MLQEKFQNVEGVSEDEKNKERIQRVPLDEEKNFVLRDLPDNTIKLTLETSQGDVVIDFNKDIIPPYMRLKRGEKWENDMFTQEFEIGEWDDGRRVTSLFHELGHITLFNVQKNWEKSVLEDVITIFLFEFDYLTDTQKRHAVSLVKEAETETIAEERAAWAWGLLKMRQVGKQHNVDLFSAFPKDARGKRTPAIREFINTHVATYKNKARKMIHDHVPRLSEEDISLLLR